ncbi:protein of unknown function [Cyanobium sp. NIES-981]|nr:protein of unknown function [Cyanobium sp. NIES-981]
MVPQVFDQEGSGWSEAQFVEISYRLRGLVLNHKNHWGRS